MKGQEKRGVHYQRRRTLPQWPGEFSWRCVEINSLNPYYFLQVQVECVLKLILENIRAELVAVKQQKDNRKHKSAHTAAFLLFVFITRTVVKLL